MTTDDELADLTAVLAALLASAVNAHSLYAAQARGLIPVLRRMHHRAATRLGEDATAKSLRHSLDTLEAMAQLPR